jgi:hypothetical protein
VVGPLYGAAQIQKCNVSQVLPESGPWISNQILKKWVPFGMIESSTIIQWRVAHCRPRMMAWRRPSANSFSRNLEQSIQFLLQHLKILQILEAILML